MAKDMLINVSEGEECRIALVEDGKLEELYMERTSSTSHVGNVYKGRVMNVEASIQAAFIDFGLGRNGFLHISDLLPSYFGRKGDDVQEFVGKKMARRDRPPIQRCLRRGDEIIVQVIKEGIGTKGPTLSAYLSISGKMLVMMPGVNGRGVSRKIEDEDERRRLKQILVSLDPPDDCGFIIRTESVGKSKAEIERDLKYLTRLWEQIKKKRDSVQGAVELYTEGDLVTRTVRDVFSGDVDQIIIDNEEVARRVRDVIKLSNPRAKNKVELYQDPIPLFHKYGIEREIEQMYSRHVPLRSGGSLVIDSTEAIVAIDVNSGKNRENSDAEMTAFKTDMEAADEICRQLKLRDLGGVIICDFIDLRYERHRRELEHRLEVNLKNDRAKTKVLPMSQFGIIEMTRQRMRPSLKRSVYFDCPHCKGAGLVKTPESMSLDVMRRLAIAIHDLKVARLELSTNPDVASYLLNKKRQSLAELESRTRKRIHIRSDSALGLDEMRLELFDNRDGIVVLDELAGVSQSIPHKTQLNTRPQPFPQRGRPDDRRHGQRPALPQRTNPREEEREAFDREVDELETRAEEFDRDEEMSEQPEQPQRPQRSERPARAASANDSIDEAYDDERDERSEAAGDDADEDRDLQRPTGQQPGGQERGGGQQRPGAGQYNGDGQEGEGGGRRRRRRRRRRGRGRGGQGAMREGQPADARDARRPLDQDRPFDDEDRGEGEAFADSTAGASSGDRKEPRYRDEPYDRDEPDDRDERGAFNEAPASRDNRRDERGGRDDRDDRNARFESATDQDQTLPWEEDRDDRGAQSRAPRDEAADFDDEDTDAQEDRFEQQQADRDRDDREARARTEREDREFDDELREIHSRAIDADAAEALDDEEGEPQRAVAAEAPAADAEADVIGEAPTEVEPAAGEPAPASKKRGGRAARPAAKGRGRKKATSAQTSDAPAAEQSEPDEAAEKPRSKTRRGSRGGKGRSKPASETSSAKAAAPAPASAAASSQPPPKPTIADTPPVVRTGSTDRHLNDEEPVHHEPVRRPRSHRDLDQIPDDYD